MDVTTLWNSLDPNKEKIELIKKDIKDGKVPELPYFVIGQNKEKNMIGDSIKEIDGERMLTNVIISRYGNGKTHLLKFLQHKFENNNNVYVTYLRTNVDQTDIFLFLLKEFENKYLDLFIDSIKNIRDKFKFADLVDKEDSNFKEIEEYCTRLLNIENDDNKLKDLIYLGTGRLYTKASFTKYGLTQLKDYNRREILVLFLNIFSKCKVYFIFGIDEIERLREKSKIRFNQFLTSYRELYDLSSKINGHLLLVCMTDSTGESKIQEANEALYSRIENYIVYLEAINDKESLLELSQILNNLFEANRNTSELKKNISKIKNKYLRNREIIKKISELILEQDEKLSYSKIIENKGIKDLYDEVYNRLEIEGAFKSINQKFFYPLKGYLGSKIIPDKAIKIQESLYIDEMIDKIHYFIFNENIGDDFIFSRINEIINDLDSDLVIYSPEMLDINYSQMFVDNNLKSKIEIVYYDPKVLMTLCSLYIENLDLQNDIAEIIHVYTKENL